MTPPNSRTPRFLASLSVLCAVIASLIPLLALTIYQRSSLEGDIYLAILLLMPGFYIIGLALAFGARRRAGEGSSLVKVALWLNLGLLIATGAAAVWFIWMLATGLPSG